MVHTCNLSNWETEAGESSVWDQPRATPSVPATWLRVRPSLKEKKKSVIFGEAELLHIEYKTSVIQNEETNNSGNYCRVVCLCLIVQYYILNHLLHCQIEIFFSPRDIKLSSWLKTCVVLVASSLYSSALSVLTMRRQIDSPWLSKTCH